MNNYIKIKFSVDDESHIIYMNENIYNRNGWQPKQVLPENAIITKEIIL